MNLGCLKYRALEWYRFSRLGTRLSYGGDPVRLLGDKTIVGIVVRPAANEVDGDCTFDVRDDTGKVWHAEVTPCQSSAVRTIARSLQVGWRVSVSGQWRWDPSHLGTTGHDEIHPVETILRLV